MRVTTLATLLVLQCSELCLAIRVPVAWKNGAVPKDNAGANNEVSVEIFPPQNAQKPVPVEYFHYPAKKPQFAVEVAAAHGDPSPENHYQAHPVKPHTGKEKPKLGVHRILDEEKKVFKPLQAYIKKENIATPVSSNYEVFHPYKDEEPALQEIYKDPVLTKIRSDLENSKDRLENYEQEPGKPDITNDEYRERPEQTDKKLFPIRNDPAEFEIHRPERKPSYYRPTIKYNHRDEVLNQKYKHPLNQNHVKIKPAHYGPLKNHLQNLRQHQSTKYDDEQNEYPQIQVSQQIGDPQEGYDIYEKGKQKYNQLRNYFDESINKAVLENRPLNQRNLELQRDDIKNVDNDDNEDEEEFVPVKNYAQVRKTETVKHLPRADAFKDADTYEEIQNAPRLREAVKSTKAQTVYTEEGYEDSAYDHAGEQKHASDHENHGGYLKQKEISGGKYKIPSLSAGFNNAGGSKYKNQLQHSEKWEDDKKNNQEETEDYSENENEQTIENDTYGDSKKEINRNKRENDVKNETELEVEKNFQERHANFKVPEINLDSTYLTEDEILSIANEKKIITPKKDDLEEKYPYYFKNMKYINKHSPLRYAENFKLIPKKSSGGTEFYDSRAKLECPEVGEINPLPENLKNGKNPTNNDDDDSETNKGEEGFDRIKDQPRLKGLGDKIDCFKAKYFGENPLDNPFFKEELIANPEPVTLPTSEIYQLKDTIKQNQQEYQPNIPIDKIGTLRNSSETNIFLLLDKLRTDKDKLQNPVSKESKKKESITPLQNNISDTFTKSAHQSNVYSDILENINQLENSNIDTTNKSLKVENIILISPNNTADNTTYNSFQNKEDVMKSPLNLRKKRATTFIYEPYKIIKENQNESTKKTNTLSNISPLIKQMQTSKVVDRVTRANREPKKRQVSGRTYKDIGRNDRSNGAVNLNEDSGDLSFVNVNANHRRAESRYEAKPANHKSEYKPVENKRSMSIDDYKSQTLTKKSEENTSQIPVHSRRNSRQRRPVLDASRYLPVPTDVENVAESNTVQNTVTTTSAPAQQTVTIPATKVEESSEQVSSEEEYEEYDEDEEEDTTSTTTTTTTTTQRSVQRRRRPTTTASTTTTTTTTSTTEKSTSEKISDFEPPKLRLITRFRNHNQEQRAEQINAFTERPALEKSRKPIEDDSTRTPKFREKKRKSSKSTLVTDTKKYGDEFDDTVKEEELDALIGVKHNMDEYKPEYEKEDKRQNDQSSLSEESDEDFISSEEHDGDNDDENLDEEDENNKQVSKPKVTTPEPTKRTLVRTTDAPIPTKPSRTTKQDIRPIVSKKKKEIHNELPVNRGSPHISQFQQDIKEEEVIKEMPPTHRRKPQKNIEVLDLYKDDNLAKEINKLDDVEVFKQDLDLKNGPRHGGNYRSAEELPSSTQRTSRRKILKDTETSQSENTRHIELREPTSRRMHGGNLKSNNNIPRSRNTGRSSKLIELSDATEPPPRPMHGGNLRYDIKPKRGRGRSEKLIELEDGHDKNSSRDRSNRNYGNTRTGHAMHGGNYKSEKLVDKSADSEYDIRARKEKDLRRSAALLLNSFAQAVPILTTTPAYILDPSKRMYYYVD